MVRELTDLIESMKINEKELLGQITELEKKYSTSSEKEVILKKQIDGLIEEKKETDERIGSLETQKSSSQKDLQDVIEELDYQKLIIKKILQEKTELEDAKILGEGEIVKMKDTIESMIIFGIFTPGLCIDDFTPASLTPLIIEEIKGCTWTWLMRSVLFYSDG